ncbi:CHAT domain-containing protein [Bradyrhizobium sp. INPA01-394B]|uniref:CHAT domain-containing protein n=1 Tax=Bradyrhizobium campsiandrae TaxID=1729892 RepID=A0ABR7UKY1_9BRAD|nr:CHAT domain-containing tetratricopeptide repeat protein [Bradyrhizobium campsiandrae]MBC9883386.1 CHAT domain-containing protein [Bradyrhizobium campsiandrae]MBC9984027.1 CHAT domain-containing protein [Bradyrhizobium campsiandrae]
MYRLALFVRAQDNLEAIAMRIRRREMILKWRRKAVALAAGFVLVAALAVPPAAAQRADIETVQKRFNALLAAGKYADALVEWQKLEAAVKARFGTEHPNYALILLKVAVTYQNQGRYDDAEAAYKRAAAILEKALGANHPLVATALDDMAAVYLHEARYGEAEALFKRALAIREQVLGPDHPDLAATLNNLAVVYQGQGRFGEAEPMLKRAMAITEKALGPNHTQVAAALVNLAILYQDQARYGDAEGLFRRALAIQEKATGPVHPIVANILHNLASTAEDQGHTAEAEALYKQALAIKEKMLGPNHPDLADTLDNLAVLYGGEHRSDEAEALYRRALAIQERALGADHPDVAHILNNLALEFEARGKYADAEALTARALAIYEKALRANHPDTANALHNLAREYAEAGDGANALAYSRKATAAVLAHAAREAESTGQKQRSGGLVAQRALFFRRHVANLALAARQQIAPEPTLAREAFEIAQWADQSSAAVAVQQFAARFASGGGALSALVRENQDLAASWRDTDRKLVEALSKPEGERDRKAIDALRRASGEAEARLTESDAKLAREFPEFAALTRPQPLEVKAVQNLLGSDEALVFFLPDDKESRVFAVTREAFAWHDIALGADALADKVKAFRRGLDVGEWAAARTAGAPGMFDLGLARDLYIALLDPVDTLIKDKRHLLVVPTGALTALPFHLLLTQQPAAPTPTDVAGYRDAAWLIKRQAVSVLPSVASLKALRAYARQRPAAQPLIGFGDPVFGTPDARGAPAAARTAAHTRAYTDYWQGAGVDRTVLGKALPALPETATELQAIAQKVGAAASDIHLEADATEANVKRLPLADYRIVYFATHGLVAGDIKGVAEPSLALSIPQHASDLDDGLLTASEVAQLKLNADWVVLSACNTVAGERPGAEALSGLARAFFYAGARALLVSHWSVASDAATRLTTMTFDVIKSEPAIGRAEALRRAMLAYLGDTANPDNAYPAFWGPFSIIGEGAARRETPE